ncbi:MAG TPA: ATP-binding protein, partial [Flavitalea sp.]|nr:ATP-binding protein [Flavitalea sp.]
MLHEPGVAGLVSNFRDITERKQTEEALLENQQLLSAIVNNSVAVIYVKDLPGRYLLVNHRFCELFHLSEEAILGKTDHDLFPKEQADTFRQMDVRTAAAVHALTEEEGVPQDDGLHTYISVKSVLKNASGQSYAIFGISTDITDRKKAQLEVQKLNEELEQKVINRTAELRSANKELESFTYSVSHDLRAPLRIIDGYSDILVTDYENKLDGEANRLLGIIKSNARRMGQLIDDLLNLSQTGRKELVMHLTDMNNLVKAVIDEQLFLTGNIATIKMGKLEPAECDSSLLRQVWINLISNALKYSGKQEKPEIQISSVHNGNEVIYSVKDNGVGFDMQYAGKLFGVFQRLHGIKEFEGTGIGLALANRILIRHKGKIWAEAEPGKGAIFYFSLPA